MFDWWPRWKIKRMYIFKAQYNESIDIGKVERDFVKIKQRWDPEKMFIKHERVHTVQVIRIQIINHTLKMIMIRICMMFLRSFDD